MMEVSVQVKEEVCKRYCYILLSTTSRRRIAGEVDPALAFVPT